MALISRKLFVCLIGLLLAQACSYKIKNFDAYQTVSIERSVFISDNPQDLLPKKRKVVIFEFDNSKIEHAERLKLGMSASKLIESELVRNKLITLVDRDSAVKLKKEIELSEIAGSEEQKKYEGPKIADIAIIGKISEVNYNSEYKSNATKNLIAKTVVAAAQVASAKDKAAGTANAISTANSKIVPPKINFSSNVKGEVKILELPSMEMLNSFYFDGKIQKSEEVAVVNTGVFGMMEQISEAQLEKVNDKVIIDSMNKGLNEYIKKISEILSPSGYIIGKKKFEKKSVFKISLGEDNGMKMGKKLTIYTKRVYFDDVKQSEQTEEVKICDAVVSDKIAADSSWIIIKDAKKENVIKFGDVVKIKFD